MPTATVTVADLETNTFHTKARTGTGPVDAAFKAVNAIVQADHVSLLEYTVRRH